MRDPNNPDNPSDPGDDGTGRDQSQQKADCRAGGGTWIGTGPYGEGYCQPQSQPSGYTDCPSGQTWNTVHKRCVTVCPDGQYNSDTDASCIPIPGYDGGGKAPSDSGGGSSTTGTYKPPAAPTPTKSPYDAAMSKQLFDTLTNMINGGDAPFGPDTIAKLQAAALQSNKSQLGNSRTELQKRLINSGLSRSGVAPSSYQKLESAAGADLSNNFRTVAVNAVQQNYNARVNALNQAQTFLQSERANSLSQDQLILAYARLNQEWKTTQATFDQQWKIVQNGNEQEMAKLMICLRTGVC